MDSPCQNREMIAIGLLYLDPFGRVPETIEEEVMGRHHQGEIELSASRLAYLKGDILG